MFEFSTAFDKYCASRAGRALLGGFLSRLSNETLALLSLRFDRLSDESVDVHELADLRALAHRAAEAEGLASQSLDEELLLASLGEAVALARLARLGYIVLDVDSLRLVELESTRVGFTDRTLLLLGAPKGEKSPTLH
mgnify:CR=1 FL=1